MTLSFQPNGLGDKVRPCKIENGILVAVGDWIAPSEIPQYMAGFSQGKGLKTESDAFREGFEYGSA